MIRQAHTYLAGAVSGSALIAAAIVAFVLLVSFQALKDWPLAGIGGGGESSVSNGQPVQGTAGGPGAAATGAAAGTAASAGAIARNGRGANGGQPAVAQQGGQPTAGTSPLPTLPASEPPSSTPAAGDSPGAPAPPSASSNPSAGGGSGGSGSAPPKGSSASGGGSGQSTSGAVTETVNDTVSGVDKTVGGALNEAGVTKVTEGVVNGAAGPESPLGETIDKTVEAVGGLLGGGHH
jgi:hypothetical protein